MSRSHWIAAIAFGLAFAFAALAQEAIPPAIEGEPVSEPRQEERAPARERDTAPEQDTALDLLPAIQGIESAIRDLISAEDQEERERQAQRERDDLQAQKDMALWAKLMFFAAIASVGLTGVGVFLIWRTLKATAAAAEAAKDMVTEAKATTKSANDSFAEARRTNDIAQSNLVAQHRPWMTIELVGAGPFQFIGRPGALRTNIALSVRNIGTGPAVDIHIGSQTYWGYRGKADRELLIRDIRRAEDGDTVAWKEILIPRQTKGMNIEQNALCSDDTENPIAPHPKIPLAVAATIFVIYRSTVSDKWLHSGHVIYFNRELPDGEGRLFSWDDGVIPTGELRFVKLPGNSSIA